MVRARLWRARSEHELRLGGGGGGSQEREPEGLRSFPVLFSLVCVFLRLCGLAWFGLHSGFVPSSKPGKQNETLPIHGPRWTWNSASIAKRVVRSVLPEMG